MFDWVLYRIEGGERFLGYTTAGRRASICCEMVRMQRYRKEVRISIKQRVRFQYIE